MPDDKLKAKQTSFENEILNTQQYQGVTNNPALGPLDPIALQSDLAGITGGTTINPTTAFVEPWIDAEGMTGVTASTITIDRSSDIDKTTRAGAPIRFSTDGSTWLYGQIKQITINASDIDLVVAGVALTVPNTAFFQVGSIDQIKTHTISFPVSLVVGDDLIDSVLDSELIWPFGEAFLVRASCRAKTPAVGSDLLINIAIGTAANNITNSSINLGQSSARIDTGTDINSSNYTLDFESKVFINADQVGSTTPGGFLTVDIIAVANTFQVEQFIPLGAPIAPFALVMTGGTSGSGNNYAAGNRVDSIDFFSMAAGSTGGSSNRGDDQLARYRTAALFDATRTFNVGGQQTGSLDDITFINTPSLTGNANSRGVIDSGNRRELKGVSGQNYGNIAGGGTSTGAITAIDILLLAAATGNTSARSVLFQSQFRFAAVFKGSNAFFMAGGSNFSGAPNTVIHYLNVESTSGGSSNRGDTQTAKSQCFGNSDRQGTTNELYCLGGDSNNGTTSAGALDEIESIDATLVTGNASNRDTLGEPKTVACGNSGPTKGHHSGGLNSTTISSAIEEMLFSTGTLVISNRGGLSVTTMSQGGDT